MRLAAHLVQLQPLRGGNAISVAPPPSMCAHVIGCNPWKCGSPGLDVVCVDRRPMQLEAAGPSTDLGYPAHLRCTTHHCCRIAASILHNGSLQQLPVILLMMTPAGNKVYRIHGVEIPVEEDSALKYISPQQLQSATFTSPLGHHTVTPTPAAGTECPNLTTGTGSATCSPTHHV